MTTNIGPDPQSDLPIPPGELLEEELVAIGLTRRQLALRMECSIQVIDEIITAKVPITDEIALRLENVLGVSARLWLNLEAQYQSAMARQQPLSSV
jgi:HTH-type transcriptional regulator/antitoxin HigA